LTLSALLRVATLYEPVDSAALAVEYTGQMVEQRAGSPQLNAAVALGGGHVLGHRLRNLTSLPRLRA
jgi:hypothetical protein